MRLISYIYNSVYLFIPMIKIHKNCWNVARFVRTLFLSIQIPSGLRLGQDQNTGLPNIISITMSRKLKLYKAVDKRQWWKF